MAYTVSLLGTAADCESVITIAEKEKSDLNFRKTSLLRQKETYAASSASIDTDIANTDTEVAALQSVVASLPAGASKDDNEKRLKKLELKKFLLAQRDKNYSTVELLMLELEIERVNKEVAETDAFIAAVNDRKAAL